MERDVSPRVRALIKAHICVCLQKTARRAHTDLLQREPEDVDAVCALVDFMDFDKLARTGWIYPPDINDDNDMDRSRALKALDCGEYPPIVLELLREIVAELSL